jgi:hypothetical protein
MAFNAVADISPQYEDYPNWWLKAYQQGTVTPLAIATDATGATQLAKVELNSDGWPITNVGSMFIPFIDGDYDLWLFPTAAEADANDTSSALQVADDLNTDPLIKLGSAADASLDDLINKFATVSAMTASTNTDVIKIGNTLSTDNYYSAIFGGSGRYIVKTSAQATTDGDVVDGYGNHTLAVIGLVAILQHNGEVDIRQYGAKADDSTDDSAAVLSCLSSDAITITNLTGVSRVSGLSIPANKTLQGADRNNTGYRRVASTTAAMFIIRDSNTINDLFFDGNAAGAGPGDSLSIDGKINVTLNRVKLVNAANDGILCRNSTNIKCKDVITAVNFRNGGSFTDNNTDIEVDGWDSKDDAVAGLDFEPNTTINTDIRASNVVVDGTLLSFQGSSGTIYNKDVQINNISAKNNAQININRCLDMQLAGVHVDSSSDFQIDEPATAGFAMTSGEVSAIMWEGKPNSSANEVINGSFESGFTGWSVSTTGSATVNIIESANSLFGDRTLSVSATSTDLGLVFSDDIIVGAQEVICVGGYIRATTGRPYIEVQCRDAASGILATYRLADKVTADNQFRNHFICITTPALTTKIKLFIGGSTTIAGGDLAGEFDGIYVYRKSLKFNFDMPKHPIDITYSAAIPTAGAYTAGDIVYNTGTTQDGNNMHVLGWRRLTTGTGHILNTDWRLMYVSSVSPAT